MLKISDGFAQPAPNLGKRLIKPSVLARSLDLTGISFASISEEELKAIIVLLKTEKIQTLILNNNQLGHKKSLNNWLIFCEGLKANALETLIIDNNELHLAENQFWIALAGLTTSPKLKMLSLQNNQLYALSEESFIAFKNMAKDMMCPCLIGFNRWEQNLDRWNQLVCKTFSKAESKNIHRFEFNQGNNDEAPSLDNELSTFTIS